MRPWLGLGFAFGLTTLGATAGAGSVATYDVVFTATWRADTHSDDFPQGLAHFSPLVGATHDDRVVFWEAGGIATPGIEAMAEVGATSGLSAEVRSAIAAGTAEELILGGAVGSSPGFATARFEIATSHPLVTLVSMIAPSPDWFVGVSGLSLRDATGWVEELSVDLMPYDAGTDDGVTFLSRDADSDPQRPIAPIEGFPFEGAPPLGTFTFQLVPEPSSLAAILASLGSAALVRAARLGVSRGRRRRSAR